MGVNLGKNLMMVSFNSNLRDWVPISAGFRELKLSREIKNLSQEVVPGTAQAAKPATQIVRNLVNWRQHLSPTLPTSLIYSWYNGTC